MTAKLLRRAIGSDRTLFRVSLRKAAREIGIQYSTLHRFERGEDIEASALLKILLWLLN